MIPTALLVYDLFDTSRKKPVDSLTWSKPAGSCLHAVHKSPQSSSKVAAFDLDGTVIASLNDKDKLRWHWWNAGVPAKLAKVASEGCVLLSYFPCIFNNNSTVMRSF